MYYIYLEDGDLFYSKYINEIEYLIGGKTFIKKDKMYSPSQGKYYYKLNKCSIGYVAKEKLKTQELRFYVPLFPAGEYADYQVYRRVLRFGMSVEPIISKQSDGEYRVKDKAFISINKNSHVYDWIRTIVLFKKSDIVFYDGSNMSVKKFYIPNIEIFNDIIDDMLEDKLITNDKNLEDTHNEILSFIEKNHKFNNII